MTYPFLTPPDSIYFLTPRALNATKQLICGNNFLNQRHLCMFSRIPGLPSVVENSPLIRAPLRLHLWWQRQRVSRSPLKSPPQLQHVSICGSGAGCCHCSACWLSVWWWAQSPARESARALGARRLVTCARRGGATGEKAKKFSFTVHTIHQNKNVLWLCWFVFLKSAKYASSD